jgi:hypothetical protein
MRVPAGARKSWAEKFRPAPVACVIRSLIPVLSPPVLGQTAYELPGTVVDAVHASADWAIPNPASHDSTVYGRPDASAPGSAPQIRAHTTDAFVRRFLLTGDDMALPCCGCYGCG